MAACSQTGCKIAQGGACLEGRGASCPHLIPDATVPDAPSTAEVKEVERRTFQSLSSGEKLTYKQAAPILQARPAQVVVLAGLIGSGKTTLLARIHEMFHVGPVNGYSFMGSETLVAFGEISWNAMVACGRQKTAMERTKAWDNHSFLHLRLRRTPDEQPVELLLNDISGETFNEAGSVQSTCASLEILARADHLVVVMDGDVLRNQGLRHVQVRAVRDFVKMALQTGHVGLHTVLHIVISKLDKLLLSGADAEGFAVKKQAEIRNEFLTLFGGIHLWKLSARPDGEFPETKHETCALFQHWVEQSVRMNVTEQPSPVEETSGREFVRFGTQIS